MIAASIGCSDAKIAAPTPSNPPPAPLTLLPMDSMLGARKELVTEEGRGFGLFVDGRDFIDTPSLHYAP